MINVALGGSKIECWISEESLRKFPEHYNEALKFKNDELIEKIKNDDKTRSDSWYGLLRQKDKGYTNSEETWYSPNLDVSDWSEMNIPGYWADGSLGEINGVGMVQERY